jgi:AbrB family looped-hinge helix DNA binding protein
VQRKRSQAQVKTGLPFRGSKMTNVENVETIFTVYLRCEGRVTVPKELRDAYGLREGDLVECCIKKIR